MPPTAVATTGNPLAIASMTAREGAASAREVKMNMSLASSQSRISQRCPIDFTRSLTPNSLIVSLNSISTLSALPSPVPAHTKYSLDQTGDCCNCLIASI